MSGEILEATLGETHLRKESWNVENCSTYQKLHRSQEGKTKQ